MANGGLDAADGAGGRQQGASPAAPVSLSSFLGAVQRLGLSVPGPGASQIVESLGSVAESKDFQNAYKLNQKVCVPSKICSVQVFDDLVLLSLERTASGWELLSKCIRSIPAAKPVAK